MIPEPISLETVEKKDGVYIFPNINNDFEAEYLKVRELENRIYSDDEVRVLPIVSNNNPHKGEWKLRQKSFHRFKEYLSEKRKYITALDLGCGNGWFGGQLSKTFDLSLYCVDVNLQELKQAARIFRNDKIKFLFADVFKADIRPGSIDLITINAAIQYFPDLKVLLDRLLTLINKTGEIHIIDSPFYALDEVENARKRTRTYYSSLGFPDMAEKYFHHTFDEMNNFRTRILYTPGYTKKNIKRLFLPKDSPFPWIVITK